MKPKKELKLYGDKHNIADIKCADNAEKKPLWHVIKADSLNKQIDPIPDKKYKGFLFSKGK